MKFTIVFICLFLAGNLMAREVDPSVLIDGVEIPFDQSESTIDKITNKIQNWLFKKDQKPSIQKDTVVSTPSKPEVEKRQRVEQVSQELPDYKTENKGLSQEEFGRIKSQFDDTKAYRIENQGRQGTSELPTSKVGVPQFGFYKSKNVKVKNLPLLDIGEEATVAMSDFLIPEFQYARTTEKKAKPLNSPKAVNQKLISKWKSLRTRTVQQAKNLIAKELKLAKPVTQEAVDAIVWDLKMSNDTAPLPVEKLSKFDIKMIAALILNEKGKNCPFIMGLFEDLSNQPKYKDEADYHLGVCAQDLKMYSEAFLRLARLVRKEHQEFGGASIDKMIEHLPQEYESAFFEIIKNLKNKDLVSLKSQDRVNYLAAKGAYKKNKFNSALVFAGQVSEKSKDYAKAKYLLGISYFSTKKYKRAIAEMEALRTWMQTTGNVSKNLQSLTAMNLARMKFNRSDYSGAFAMYMKVHKNHPLWVQGLVEQGWAQLLLKDSAGAIGNMYSLHSPYFKAVYKPESYAVRTIGYLNICQYGDAYQTLKLMEKEYNGWDQKVATYIKSNKDKMKYYNTVVTYLKGHSSKNIDGLPYQVIREIGHKKDFLNYQTSVNEKIDELQNYIGINSAIKKEKSAIRWKANEAKRRLAQVSALLKKSKTDKSLVKELNTLKAQYRHERDLVLVYNFQLAIYEQSRQKFLKLRARGEKRIASEKTNLKTSAGIVLAKHLKKLSRELRSNFSNNEFLRYEVFSGSGQNIRYQVAGGKVGGKQRIPASVKPEKSLNWSFEGEFWEDEIGSYRSSLRNNCPKQRAMPSPKSKKNNQASNQ